MSLKWGKWQIRIGRAIRDWGTTPPGDRGWDEGWKMQRREKWLIIFFQSLSSFLCFFFFFFLFFPANAEIRKGRKKIILNRVLASVWIRPPKFWKKKVALLEFLIRHYCNGCSITYWCSTYKWLTLFQKRKSLLVVNIHLNFFKFNRHNLFRQSIRPPEKII